MKKTLIASAVAAATLSTSAFAMDNSQAEKILGMFDSMPKISGDIEIFGSYTDSNGASGNTDGIMDDVDSTVAISHETAISEETTAYVNAEFIYNSTVSGSGLGSDTTVLGFKGGFGDVSLGTQDSVYEAVDIIDFSENLGGVVAGDLLGAAEDQTINYTTPTIGEGITLSASMQTDEDVDNIGSLALAYSADDLTVNFGYGMNDVNEDVIGISAAMTMDDLTISAQFETQDETGDIMGVLATYAMGVNTLNFAIINQAPDGGDDVIGISGNVIHNLADNVYVYVEASFQSSDNDAAEMDQYVVGTTYSF